MKMQFFLACTLCCLALMACDSSKTTDNQPEEGAVATETAAQESDDAEAWTPLFDGSGLDHWRDYKGNAISWQVEDGTLTTPGGKGDIITKETYGNFEMEFDWKLSEGGNSGVMYLVQEGDHEATFHTGPEYQLIDTEGYEKKSNTKLEKNQVTGANYALQAPASEPAKPVGTWNQGKIVVNNGHVEHWVNGEKVVEYDLWTDAWKNQVSQTKFKEWPEYGMAKEGHIALQDHGDRAWFRNIRIREL